MSIKDTWIILEEFVSFNKERVKSSKERFKAFKKGFEGELKSLRDPEEIIIIFENFIKKFDEGRAELLEILKEAEEQHLKEQERNLNPFFMRHPEIERVLLKSEKDDFTLLVSNRLRINADLKETRNDFKKKLKTWKKCKKSELIKIIEENNASKEELEYVEKILLEKIRAGEINVEKAREYEKALRKKIFYSLLLSVVPESTPKTFFEFLISLFDVPNLEINVVTESSRDSKGTRYFFICDLSFNTTKAYENFISAFSQLRSDILILEKYEFNAEGYLIADFKEEIFDKMTAFSDKHEKGLIKIKQYGKDKEKTFGIKIDFEAAILRIYDKIVKSSSSGRRYAIKKIRIKKAKGKKTKVKKQAKKTHRTRNVVISAGVVAGVIILIVLGTLFYRADAPIIIGVEKYNSVRLQYTVWYSDDQGNYEKQYPLFNSTFWTNVSAINDPNRKNNGTGLILGLYNNLLGKPLYYESDVIFLMRCVDNNWDGIDDNSGNPALSYGHPSHQYFNKSLQIKFKVLYIEKN